MKIGVIGLDARQFSIVEELSKHGLEVILVNNIKDLHFDFDYLVLPLKGCDDHYLVYLKEGLFDLSKYLVENKNVIVITGLENPWINQITTNVIYLMNKKEVLKENSEITAQGLLVEIIKRIDCNLKQVDIDVLGYGNCGFEIVSLLSSIVRSVRVIVKKNEFNKVDECNSLDIITYDDWSNKQPYSLVINTVPTLVITKEIMHRWIEKPIILDIASHQGGVDYKEARLLNINAILLPSLPPLYAPKTAGKILAHAILKELHYE